MQSFPETPPLADADLTGHLWIQELPTGGRLRFQLSETGVLTFGTARQTGTATEDLPVASQRAITTVRRQLDRDALREATDDPATVTLFGRATWAAGIDYDWTTLPPFVGTDVWSGNRDGYLPPDTATTVFDRLNLPTLPAIEKEAAVEHTDLTRYTDGTGFPASAWYDGPAAGVLVRDKTGNRGNAWLADRDADRAEPASATVAEVVDAYATLDAIETTVGRLEAEGRQPTVDAVTDRLVADIAREHYARLHRDGDPVVARDAVRSAVAERVQRALAGDD